MDIRQITKVPFDKEITDDADVDLICLEIISFKYSVLMRFLI